MIKSKMVALYNDNITLYKYKNELEKIINELKQQLLNNFSILFDIRFMALFLPLRAIFKR